MSRSKNYDREYTQNDKLKKENQSLKRENLRLRNENERLRNLAMGHARPEKAEAKRVSKQAEKCKICPKCKKGDFDLIKIPKPDGEYFRFRCSIFDCNHQTPLKKLEEPAD